MYPKRATCCPKPPIQRCPVSCDAQNTTSTQYVDSLVVNSLYTTTQVGGSLVLNGAPTLGSKGQTTNIGLHVRSDVNFEGITSTRNIAAQGPIATSHSLASPQVSVSSIHGLTVAGAPTGPFAVNKQITDNEYAQVLVTDGTRVNAGFAVSSSTLVTSLWWETATLSTIGAVGSVLQIVYNTTDGGQSSVNATIVSISASGGIALLSVHSGVVFGSFFQIEGGDLNPDTNLPRDVPARGAQVMVWGADTELGTQAFYTGNVTDGSANMFYEFTSVHVSVDGTTAVGVAGSPIIDVYNKVIALVQYGAPDSGGVYTRVVGGISGRYIKHLINTYNATGAGTVEIPVLVSGQTGTTIYPRGIRAQERSPLFLRGGVAALTTSTDTATPANQVVKVIYNDGSSEMLGMRGADYISLQHSLFGAYYRGLRTATLVYGASATASPSASAFAPRATATEVVTWDADIVAANAMWQYGSPTIGTDVSIGGGFCNQPAGKPQYGTNFNIANFSSTSVTIQSIVSVSYTCYVSSKSVGVLNFGNVDTANSYRAVLAIWGTYAAVNYWIKGVSGELNGAWVQYGPSPTSAYVFTVFIPPETATATWQVYNYTVIQGTLVELNVTALPDALQVNVGGATGIGQFSTPYTKVFNVYTFITDSFTSDTCQLISNGGMQVLQAYTPVPPGPPTPPVPPPVPPPLPPVPPTPPTPPTPLPYDTLYLATGVTKVFP